MLNQSAPLSRLSARQKDKFIEAILKLGEDVSGSENLSRQAAGSPFSGNVNQVADKFDSVFNGPNGLKRTAFAMQVPLKSRLDYVAVGRNRLLLVDETPQGDFPVYDLDIPEFGATVLGARGRPPIFQANVKRITFPTFPITVNHTVKYEELQVRRYPIFDRAKERSAIAVAIAEDDEVIRVVKTASEVGVNAPIVTGVATATRFQFADGFAAIMSNQLIAATVLMHPRRYADILKFSPADLDQVSVNTIIETGLFGVIYGARLLVTTRVPLEGSGVTPNAGSVYITTTPDKLGRLPERKAVEVKIFDNIPYYIVGATIRKSSKYNRTICEKLLRALDTQKSKNSNDWTIRREVISVDTSNPSETIRLVPVKGSDIVRAVKRFTESIRNEYSLLTLVSRVTKLETQYDIVSWEQVGKNGVMKQVIPMPTLNSRLCGKLLRASDTSNGSKNSEDWTIRRGIKYFPLRDYKLSTLITCRECDRNFREITPTHLKFAHGLTVTEYKQKYGLTKLCSEASVDRRSTSKRSEKNPMFAKTSKRRNGRVVTCCICSISVYREKYRLSDPHSDKPVKNHYCSKECLLIGLKIERHMVKVGADHPNWKGGQLYPPEFSNDLKRKVMERDGFTCQSCKGYGRGFNLEIHHIDYNKFYNSMENLITLCKVCHGRMSRYEQLQRKGIVRTAARAAELIRNGQPPIEYIGLQVTNLMGVHNTAGVQKITYTNS